MDVLGELYGDLKQDLGVVVGYVLDTYNSLPPEQQRNSLLALGLLVVGLFFYWSYQSHGDRAMLVVPASFMRVTMLLLALPFVAVGKAAGRGTTIPDWLRYSWTEEDPDRPGIKYRRVKPMKKALPFYRAKLKASEWVIFGVLRSKTYALAVIAIPGSGKDESVVGPAIYHEMVYGRADMVILDPKLEQLYNAIEGGYLPEDADIYIYGTHPGLAAMGLTTDAFDVFGPLENRLTPAMMLAEEDSNNQHWQAKAGALLYTSADGLEAHTGEPATLMDVREVVMDRDALAELRGVSRDVDNVADTDNEWGAIRSTARRALEPLYSESLQKMFDAERLRMPDYSSERRQIVFLCPDDGAGPEQEKLWAAIIEILIQMGKLAGKKRVQKYILNEAGSFIRLPRLSSYVTIGRGHGIYLMFIFQAWSQLVEKLGVAGARSLWNTVSTQIVGYGAEPELGREMSGYTNPNRRTHRQPRQHRDAPGGERVTEERRRELEEHHITSQEPGEWTSREGTRTRRYRVKEKDNLRPVLGIPEPDD